MAHDRTGKCPESQPASAWLNLWPRHLTLCGLVHDAEFKPLCCWRGSVHGLHLPRTPAHVRPSESFRVGGCLTLKLRRLIEMHGQALHKKSQIFKHGSGISGLDPVEMVPLMYRALGGPSRIHTFFLFKPCLQMAEASPVRFKAGKKSSLLQAVQGIRLPSFRWHTFLHAPHFSCKFPTNPAHQKPSNPTSHPRAWVPRPKSSQSVPAPPGASCLATCQAVISSQGETLISTVCACLCLPVSV